MSRVLSSPAFLKKRGELRTRDIGLCVAATALLLIPAAGLVYPVPPPPVNAFPYVFGAYLFIGYVRIMAMQHQKPSRIEEIDTEIKRLAQPA
jgi:hypothetical protein